MTSVSQMETGLQICAFFFTSHSFQSMWMLDVRWRAPGPSEQGKWLSGVQATGCQAGAVEAGRPAEAPHQGV